jgi:carnitine O-palmitoyltransferase 2
MDKSISNKNDIVDLMRKASKAHYELCKDGAMGQGFDRHLFGLKFTAERLNRPVPQLFNDKIFQVLKQVCSFPSDIFSE